MVMRSLGFAALVCAAACTVNGKALGPQLGGVGGGGGGGGPTATTPAGPAASGSTTSAGNTDRAMPLLLGKTLDEAKAALKEAGFSGDVVLEPSNDHMAEQDTCHSGLVCGQTPMQDGSVDSRMTIHVYVAP